MLSRNFQQLVQSYPWFGGTWHTKMRTRRNNVCLDGVHRDRRDASPATFFFIELAVKKLRYVESLGMTRYRRIPFASQASGWRRALVIDSVSTVSRRPWLASCDASSDRSNMHHQ